MKPELQIGIEQIVDKIISQVATFERRHPMTKVDTDITGLIGSYMLEDSIQDLNKELAKHNIEIIQFFAMNKVDYTWHAVSIN